ncbi:MAG TPA: hypothetical protein VME47_17295 [Acetobacteraceae bacterium]|nr:hypothetical protein [Acetobacteraceae bacterium]
MARAKRAIVYVAWGEPHVREAVTSARTAGLMKTDRLLITNAASRRFLPQDAPFERVIEHAFQLPGQLAKSEMFALLPPEYGSFLFLDSDTYILLDVSLGFEKAEIYGIAAAQSAAYSLEHFWGFASQAAALGVPPRDILQYNTGVIFFTRAPRAWAVMRKWHNLCTRAPCDATAWGDQPYFAVAMEQLGFNPYTLSTAYNYRSFGELANGQIRIWHSRAPPPDDVNVITGPWPFRRFLEGRRLPEGS